jgi:demethylmenaquinone methyltransferase/2-methoxy-6-polyprenyl-1,4-benzoquinol methylase
MSKRSRIEVKGLEARFYDELLWLVTLGGYQRLLRAAVERMDLKEGESVLDLGSGTGYIAKLIAPRVGPRGRVLGLDIGEEMLRRARHRCKGSESVEFRRERIDEPLLYHEEFDKVFTSFVLHGLEQPQRERVIENAYQALRPGGRFFILDWNNFPLEHASPPIKLFFKRIECELAQEFIRLDLKEMLRATGFAEFAEWPLGGRYIRLLAASKSN